MQSLRRAHLLARFVLVWFALSIGVAIASPVIKPQAMELICSGTGVMKLLVQTDDGVKEVSTHSSLDCPLCAGFGAPPLAQTVLAPSQKSLGHVLQPVPAAHIAWLTAAPLPARGPPSLPKHH
jgi:hypothetical protein